MTLPKMCLKKSVLNVRNPKKAKALESCLLSGVVCKSELFHIKCCSKLSAALEVNQAMFKHVINISSMALVQNYTGHVSGLEIH